MRSFFSEVQKLKMNKFVNKSLNSSTNDIYSYLSEILNLKINTFAKLFFITLLKNFVPNAYLGLIFRPSRFCQNLKKFN